MTAITIISFGFRHGEPPVADWTADVQRCLRDPLDTHLRELTGLDEAIRDHVLQTPGAWGIARSLAEAGERLWSNTGQPVVLAVGCGGGRHRAPAIAVLTAAILHGVDIEVIHRDIDKPVLAPLVREESQA
jgi:RNase adaptor protein for sRNA GlmZ degradation